MSPLTPEQQEELARTFAANRARQEALTRKQRAEAGEFSIELVRANDDPPEEDAVFQEELSRFGASLHAAGVPYSQLVVRVDAVDAFGYSLPEFIFAISALGAAIPALVKISIAWVQARNGRKVRLKIGDVEAEAPTTAEIETLLEKAAAFQDRDRAES